MINEDWTAFKPCYCGTAASRFADALAQDNSLLDAHHGLGWAQARLGHSGEAVNHFLIALHQNTALLSAKAGLAFTYNVQMQYEVSN